jgi:hypothetical protein
MKGTPMPKSKRRPAAVAKAKNATRRKMADAYDDGLGFVESPWATWLRAKQDARVQGSPEMLTVLEHSPFRINEGALTSLASMASEVGQTVAEAVECQFWLESQGFVAWDRATQSAILTVPADR